MPPSDLQRAKHARRSAETHAAFFLDHLAPGMALLDLGCGPGTITVGLAERVAPGPTTGMDLTPAMPDNELDITLVTGDVHELPFSDASFDAIFASALLQHVRDPRRVLAEARRVARPGAVIGVVDADWDGQLVHPTNALLERSFEIGRSLRRDAHPGIGKQLRSLLVEAGFVRCTATARAVSSGTPEDVAAIARQTPSVLFGRHDVDDSIATRAELDELTQAWLDWADQPGAFLATFWCEAIGWVDPA